MLRCIEKSCLEPQTIKIAKLKQVIPDKCSVIKVTICAKICRSVATRVQCCIEYKENIFNADETRLFYI